VLDYRKFEAPYEACKLTYGSIMETVIIGSGLAAYLLAREFRRLNTLATLRIVTQSDGCFYSKPLLSTAFTRQKTPEMLVVSSALEMAEELQAEISIQTTVNAIYSEQKILRIEDNDGKISDLSYKQLVLACGSLVLDHKLQGEAAAEILSVNNLQDYALFRGKLLEKSAKKVAIIGAGLVGCEFANDLCNAGYSLDVICMANQPLEKLLPAQLGQLLQFRLTELGVRWHVNTIVKKISKQDNFYVLHLTNGEIIHADLVLSAIGLRANTQLATMSGIAVNKGIQVNSYLETNLPSIYALGDCAEVNGELMFYITPLRKCVYALARTLVGDRAAAHYPGMPVSIKTPACPIVASPPPKGLTGRWEITRQNQDLQALYYDQHNCLRGFALTGDFVKARVELTNLLPALF
jgi:rubredoxin-NAD+ reductase